MTRTFARGAALAFLIVVGATPASPQNGRPFTIGVIVPRDGDLFRGITLGTEEARHLASLARFQELEHSLSNGSGQCPMAYRNTFSMHVAPSVRVNGRAHYRATHLQEAA